jgi:hypothetical protein
MKRLKALLRMASGVLPGGRNFNAAFWKQRTSNNERRILNWGILNRLDVRCFPCFACIFAGIFFTTTAAFSAERFGDISVSPQSLASGETFHGYREMRVVVENNSATHTHVIRLEFPAHSFGYGNSISRISRTVSLAPSTRSVVPLWQPPLPATGDNMMRVFVDNDEVGTVSSMDVSRHMINPGMRYGGGVTATILVSRNLNYDDLDHLLKSGGARGLTAEKAVGMPDSGGRRGLVSTAWSPDVSQSGPHWLELDYDHPIQADSLSIYETMTGSSSGDFTLIGVSGTNLYTQPLSRSSRRSMTMREFSFPTTSEPVKTVRINFGSSYAGSISVDAVELKGPSGAKWATAARASSEAPGTTAASGENRELIRAELPIAEWSDTWLSYTPYDVIALTGAELNAMPPAARSALFSYAECGGNLLVLGAADVPKTWRPSQKILLSNGTCFDSALGECFVFSGNYVNDIDSPSAKKIMSAAMRSATMARSTPDENSANGSFPVVANVKIPVRGIVFIMLAFVIVIGPVNMFVLARKNRRTWLLWTIPAISFATCSLVYVYSLFREGVTPDARIEGLTFLDQPDRRAITLGTEAFYCPLTPSAGLFFGTETEATPLVSVGGGYSGGSRREMDWTQSQHLERGWISARVPAHFQIRKAETRRERLEIEHSGNQLLAVNGLGATIRSLVLADESGRIYSAANIAAGKKAVLFTDPQSHLTQRLGARAYFEKFGFMIGDNFSETNITDYLLPGSYIADLETNPFLENGLGEKAKTSRVHSRAVVFGILEKASQP